MIGNCKAEDKNDTVRVWDRFLRFFHWSLVLCFATVYVSGKAHAALLHELAGYVLCALLAARVYWGFRGTEHARFQAFLYPPRAALTYLRALLRGNPPHYLGHNPAGALMVFALLGLLGLLLGSGLLALGTIHYAGPLMFLGNDVSDASSYSFLHLHTFLPNIVLGLIALHLLGVLVGSIQHRENLVRAMLTGNKKMPAAVAANDQHYH